MQRIWERDLLAGQPVARLSAILNDSVDHQRVSFFDTVRMAANSDKLEDLENGLAPLNRLEVKTACGDTLSYLALFEEDGRRGPHVNR